MTTTERADGVSGPQPGDASRQPPHAEPPHAEADLPPAPEPASAPPPRTAPLVFISHSSADAATAQHLTALLEGRGVRCWIAPRDINPGLEYPTAIAQGIESCSAMVLIITETANNSRHVLREVERAVSKGKPVFPIRLRNIMPSGALEYLVGANQWIDAFKSPIESQIDRIVAAVGAIDGGKLPAHPVGTPAPTPPANPPAAPGGAPRIATARPLSLQTIVIGLAVAVGVLALLLVFLLGRDSGTQVASGPTPAPLPAATPQPAASAPQTATIPAAPAGPQPGETFRDCPTCPELTALTTEPFQIGAQVPLDGDNPEEFPATSVAPSPFAIALRETSRAEYAAFATATGRPAGEDCQGFREGQRTAIAGATWQAPGWSQADDHPVVCVSWEDATAFAAWLSETTGKPYRLPSEAQWEYAARARFAEPSYWGGGGWQPCDFANGADRAAEGVLPVAVTRICSDGAVTTMPAGSLRPNRWGLYDLLGNAAEWTADCWVPNHAGRQRNGTPTERPDCTTRGVRGGSWADRTGQLRIAARQPQPQTLRDDRIGFRVVRLLAP